MAEDKPGKLLKVLFFDEQGSPMGEYKSTQIPDDPFENKTVKGLQDPPFPLEQLIFLAEIHPIHSATLEQKTADVIGTGWDWKARDEDDPDEEADDELRKQLDEWFNDLAGGEQTMHEILKLVWDDFETLGQGFFEISRDTNGKVGQVYHVPGHTVRFHRDGQRLAQVRGQKTVWFKRWGAPNEQDVHRSRGTWKDKGELDETEVANELLVVQKPSRRSTWYGIPTYISAVGWITLALAARDDNLLFFNNRREPRWAVVMTNLEESDDLEESLRQAFTVDLKQPHRNILIPITGKGEVKFEKLGADRADGSFERLSERADAAILVAHRCPPERLGMSKVGPLGGNVVNASSRVYKEAVVSPSQTLLAARINRFIAREFDGVPEDTNRMPWLWEPKELDLAEEAEDLRQSNMAFAGNMITLREARARIGLGPLMKKVGTPDEIKQAAKEMNVELDEEPTEELVTEIEDERNDKLLIEITKGEEPEDPWAQASFGGGFGSFNDPWATQPQQPIQPMELAPEDQEALETIQQQLRELVEKNDA